MSNKDKVRVFIMASMENILKEHGWNVNQMAEAVDLNSSTIYSFFNMKVRTPTISTVFHICDKLHWPYARFFLEKELMLIPREKLAEHDKRLAGTRLELFLEYYDLWFRIKPDQHETVVNILKSIAGDKL